uniref:Putative rte ele1 orf1-h 1e-60-j 4 n=1 Tax=Amblyomma triste TaxID=251400 RepID=A0A023G8J5_AMBTT
MSKAFDVVTHSLLLEKLLLSGVEVSLVALLRNYLLDRFCFVSVNGQTSFVYPATSGVPQGSVLGPLLFSVFINDVSSAIKNSSFLLYADDIKIFKVIHSFQDCVLLQSDISAFSDWCAMNRLTLNSSKTRVVSFTRKTHSFLYHYSVNSVLLDRVDEINDLGVLFDRTLSFSSHTKRIAQRAMRTLGFVCRLSREFRTPLPFLKLYLSICLPLLEYASVVWNGTCKSNLDKVDRVPKKFLRIFHYRFPCATSPSRSTRSAQLNLPSLHCRRIRLDIIFLYKLLHGHIMCPQLLEYILLRVPRKSMREFRPFQVSPLHSHSPLDRMQWLFNSFCPHLDMFQNSLCSFTLDVRSVVF